MALGVEAAGTIAAIGDSVEDWGPGAAAEAMPAAIGGGAGGAVVLRP
jgi:NADPH:quinone reductase-like Zn-dependent oxidoreductase